MRDERMAEKTTIDALKIAYSTLGISEFRGQTRVVVPAGLLYEVLKGLRKSGGSTF